MGGAEGTSKTERFALAHAADFDGAELLRRPARCWAKINHTILRRRVAGKHSVESRPAL
ncbi:MAG: hypothetical protein ACRECP_07285 [Methylocella sp.]